MPFCLCLTMILKMLLDMIFVFQGTCSSAMTWLKQLPATMFLFYRYESFVGTVAKKFSTKRKRSSVQASFESDSPSTNQPSKKAKREFMKPRD